MTRNGRTVAVFSLLPVRLSGYAFGANHRSRRGASTSALELESKKRSAHFHGPDIVRTRRHALAGANDDI